MKTSQWHLKIGQSLTLTIKKMGINGEGIGYWRNHVIFVPQVLPGEIATIEITHIAPNYLRGRLIKLKKTSPHRNLQPPVLAKQVGGLELAHLLYPQQLSYKQAMLHEALRHFRPRGWQKYHIQPTIGMNDPWHYRNKAQFPIRIVNGKLICGLFKPGSHTIVDCLEMPTQGALTLSILQRLVPLIQSFNLPIYQPESNSGILKTLVVRENPSTNQAQLTFITNSWKLPQKRALIAAINQKIPEVISIAQNFNPGTTSLIWGTDTKILWGQSHLIETIGKIQFQLSPAAFFQLNLTQTEKLYQVVQQMLNPRPTDTIVDAYAGVGTIGLSLAAQVQTVIGSEISSAAVRDANANAELNHLTNAHYECGRTAQLYPQWLQRGLQPSAVIVDPPRTGLEPEFLQFLNQSHLSKIIYLSCNPSTWARDLRTLSQVYHIQTIQPVDMFPQTPHVESVTLLKRRRSSKQSNRNFE